MRSQLRQIAIDNIYRLAMQLKNGLIDGDRFILLSNKELSVLNSLCIN